MKLITHILFILFFLIISAELIQNQQPFITVEDLQGAIIKVEKPVLTLENWLNGNFQDSVIKYNELNMDLHPFFIRLNNQIGYSLFGEVKVKDSEVGKDQILFEAKYIKSFLGQDFVGEDSIKEKINKLAYVKRELKKYNVDLILVLVPGKPSFFPESLPSKYDLLKKTRTNYEAYTEQLDKNHFEYLDFEKYLLQLKPSTPYPFFTRLGTHWSLYAGVVAADSLFDHMQHVRKIEMIHYTKKGGEVTTKPRDSDADIEEPMNLLFHIPSYPMYYPNITFQNDSTKIKPDVLIIGDSFIWNWINYYPFFPTLFDKKSAFWYYNREVWWPVPPGPWRKQPIKELNLYDQTMKRDFIIIESTENNLSNLGNRFIENMYDILKEKEYDSRKSH